MARALAGGGVELKCRKGEWGHICRAETMTWAEKPWNFMVGRV